MKPMTHTQTVMLRLLTMCIPFRNLRKKWRTFLRDFLSDYDRDARRSMRAWRRHPVAGRTILILEPNYCHGEVIPGFCRHLLDMGYRVDVLMHHSLARQSPLCCFKEGDIHIFTAMCTSWKRLAKARVPGRENSRTAPAPSLRPAGTAKGTGMSENPPRTMKRTNERKPPNYFPYGEKRLPPAKIPAPAFKDFKFPPLLQITDIPFPA